MPPERPNAQFLQEKQPLNYGNEEYLMIKMEHVLKSKSAFAVMLTKQHRH